MGKRARLYVLRHQASPPPLPPSLGPRSHTRVELLGAQHDAIERRALQLGRLLRRQDLESARRDQVDRHSLAHAPGAPPPLLEVGPRAAVLNQRLQTALWVVAVLLHSAGVDDIRDVINGNRGLGDVRGDDDLDEAGRRPREDAHLLLRGQRRVQWQDPFLLFGRVEHGLLLQLSDGALDLLQARQENQDGATITLTVGGGTALTGLGRRAAPRAPSAPGLDGLGGLGGLGGGRHRPFERTAVKLLELGLRVGAAVAHIDAPLLHLRLLLQLLLRLLLLRTVGAVEASRQRAQLGGPCTDNGGHRLGEQLVVDGVVVERGECVDRLGRVLWVPPPQRVIIHLALRRLVTPHAAAATSAAITPFPPTSFAATPFAAAAALGAATLAAAAHAAALAAAAPTAGRIRRLARPRGTRRDRVLGQLDRILEIERQHLERAPRDV